MVSRKAWTQQGHLWHLTFCSIQREVWCGYSIDVSPVLFFLFLFLLVQTICDMDALSSEGRLTSKEHFWICMDSVSYLGLKWYSMQGSRIQNAQKCSPREVSYSVADESVQLFHADLLVVDVLVQHWSLDLASQVPAKLLKKDSPDPGSAPGQPWPYVWVREYQYLWWRWSTTRHSKPSAWEAERLSARCVYNHFISMHSAKSGVPRLR